MDTRGFGRSGLRSRRHTLVAAFAALAALTCLMLFAYDLITSTLPSVTIGGLALTLRSRDLVGIVGLGLAVLSVRSSGHGVRRSRYRPDRWRLPELLTVACGVVPVFAILGVAAGSDAASLYPAVLPVPEIPVLPTAILVGALVALLPAVITPPAETAVEVAA
jgi:energy-coupling factor transport system permease protein